ncbi:PVC-type heme-binding CxxCH protein [Singulisphaera sp. PoT]|uniref:PVC-type heme-binding CxxCH protein n=1 Tax=Singulisphaera sp. PoT TaxID=3411797 RepID=UPI003BF49D81
MKRLIPALSWVFLAANLTSLGSIVSGSEQIALLQLERSRAKYTTNEAWTKRRAELRRAFLEGAGMWPLPARAPVTATIRDRREYPGYSVENVAIETLPGFYCTGNLYRPLKQDKTGPAILHPHGHFQPLGRLRDEQQTACIEFARRGATVFSYAMVGWQDCQQTTHDDPLVLALQTWNSIRSLDFIEGLTGVDPKRIGITGASGGGTQSFFLALVDDRIKASAPVVIVYPWTEDDGCRCEGGLPIMSKAGTNAIELAAATSPRPQLLISVGGTDGTRTFPTLGFPFIQAIYKVAGAPSAARNLHLPDEAHDFGPSKLRAVTSFFVETLGLNPAPDPESKPVLEMPKALEVFNAERPLPPGAIRGSDAMAKAFASVFKAPQAKVQNPIDGPLVEYAFQEYSPADDAILFTPSGHAKVGMPAEANGADAAHLRLVVTDKATGKPTPCRINVVGPDGNYYEPAEGQLKKYSLSGQWPGKGWGNRVDKAPIRYFGRFFYTNGRTQANVPPGILRIEVSKGLEYKPEVHTLKIGAGETREVALSLDHAVLMPGLGYLSGDPHVHIPREKPEDDGTILDLMEAEDIHHATMLAYNEPPGPYTGVLGLLASPQMRGMGKPSTSSRGDYSILSGQEYRSSTYGHMNLFLLDQIVMAGESRNANNWPLYGDMVRKARETGGIAFYAHGGYAQSIYADVAQGNIDAVELLQFGVYRGIGLTDWYRMLNSGFRIPAVGACDYPACRKLADCVTYAEMSPKGDTAAWLKSTAEGRSFVTTGPMLLLEVDGQKPGARIARQGPRPHVVRAKIRVRSEVTPVTNVELIVNGRMVGEKLAARRDGLGLWIEFEQEISLDRSAWVAARAYSYSPLGTPDAESHTNPIYVDLDGKTPYERASLDVLIQRLDGQIAAHKAREFPEKARVLAYFDKSRDILLKIREAGGASAEGHPSDLAVGTTEIEDPGRRTHTEEELRAFLRPIPPKAPEEAVRSFETKDGFTMELVAAEPLVYSPTAAAFDENGNLYVAEMVDYPYKPKLGQEPLGSIRLLIDEDGDGRFDKGHVFADKLLWAAGIAPWKGGVFVASPPDIWYLKDTDGDHKADIREKVYTGFGTKNQQAMLNNFAWGLDHKVYGSTAGNGGLVRQPGKPETPPIDVDGRDFRFDPSSRRFEATTGTVQFGNTFDDWGNRFLCSESQPLLQAVLPLHYLARNPYLAVANPIQNLTEYPVPIFRISPVERWRQIRSSRRIAHNNRPATAAGASHHVVDAAAGVTVYRGGAYPPEYQGNIFVGDAQNNLVHRRTLEPSGVTFTSKRADPETEFVRSPDNWFRPVNFVNAPDGTLYVLDMSREYLESIHIPNDVVKYLDLSSGRDHGRIYRIAPPGFRYPGPPRPGKASAAELVDALESPHGWFRDTAHRLLYERQDPAAVAPLRDLLERSDRPQSRILALWSLQGLGALQEADLIRGLSDREPHVVTHALRLSESKLGTSPQVLDRVLALVSREEPIIRCQLAFTLGESKDPRAVLALANIARTSSSDPWIRQAILSSATESSADLFDALTHDTGFAETSSGADVLSNLISVVGARRNPAEMENLLETLARAPGKTTSGSKSFQMILALGESLRRSGGWLDLAVEKPEPARRWLDALIHDAKQTCLNQKIKLDDRLASARLVACLSFAKARETLGALLDVRQPEPLQVASLQALAGHAEPEVASMILGHWKEYLPEVRGQAIDALSNHEGHTLAFLDAVAKGDISTSQVDPVRRSRLLAHRSETIRKLAAKSFAQDQQGGRQEIVAAFRSVLKLEADQSRGRAIFSRECASCHRIGGIGHVVGPDLTSSAAKDGETLLTHILDPNRDVLPNYLQYQVADTDGRIFSGLIAAQSGTSVTLRKEAGLTETLLRSRIEQIASSGVSLMPEGFELKIGRQEMADLIAFLQSSRTSPEEGDAPLDIGTEPGIVEPDGAGR